MKLIIFDLDQTIIEMHKFHNKATEKTFKQVFGIKASLYEIDFAGKPIERVLEELAELKKINQYEIKKKLPKAISLYRKNFISTMPKSTKKFVLPGANSLIKILGKNKSDILIMVTGGEKIIAQEVLSRADLLKYFKFIVTGEKERSRTKLTKLAIGKAKKLAKIEKIFIIGDSVHEIEAGKATNATTITVLTGFHSKEKLKRAGAKHIFKNLKDKKILKLINEK